MKTRKELNAEYKQMKPKMGVFQIKNRNNNKILVDCSLNIDSKINRHRMELNMGSHRNHALQSDWNKEGAENFDFEVLSKLKEEDEVDYSKELKILHEMVLEEMVVPAEIRY